MHSLTVNGGEEPDPELRQPEFKKNQYGPIAESVLLRWKNGVFCPEPRMGSLEQLARERKVEELFLTLLANFERQGRPVSHKQSPSFAPALFAKTA
jgi:RecA-family ATPase